MDNEAAMGAALRVLVAVRERKPPDSNDVEALRQWDPKCNNLPADELACKIIRSVVEEHTRGRASGANE